MPDITIPYHETGYFSKIVCDYLAENSTLKSFYHRFPSLDNFGNQLKEKGLSVSPQSRTLLVDSLNKQYKGIAVSDTTQNNIDSVQTEYTFTINNRHQHN